MLFEFGKVFVDIEVEATRNFYRNKLAENDCACAECVNFRRFADSCDARINQAFSDMGIDNMKYIYEVIPYNGKQRIMKKKAVIFTGDFSL